MVYTPHPVLIIYLVLELKVNKICHLVIKCELKNKQPNGLELTIICQLQKDICKELKISNFILGQKILYETATVLNENVNMI